MHRKLLPHRATVEPLVAARYVPHARVDVHEPVKAVAHHILRPVVLGVYRPVGHAVCGILHHVLLALGHGHLGIGGYLAIHHLVDITVDKRRIEPGAHPRLPQVDPGRRGRAVGHYVDVDPVDALSHDEALFEAQVGGGIAEHNLRVVGSLPYYFRRRRVEVVVLVGRVVKVDSIACQHIGASAESHLADASVAADSHRHRSVGHFVAVAVAGKRHVRLCACPNTHHGCHAYG